MHNVFSMLVSNAVFDNKSVLWPEKDNEDCWEPMELRERLCKTLYYGRMPALERPSLALTELAVDMLQEVAPRELGKVDMYWASDVSRNTTLSACPMTVGLMYAKRLKKKNSSFARQISSSDLFLVSMMMASKFLHDEGEKDSVVNEDWATSAHMDVEELNRLERNFLAALDWELYVNADDFWASLYAIEKLIACKKSGEHGSCTYTDLCVLVDSTMSTSLRQILLQVCKIVAVCVVAYAASLAVLAGLVPAAYTVAVTISSWVPACHHMVLDSQSAFSDVVVATSTDKDVKSFDKEQTSVEPQLSLVNMFIDMLTSSSSFPADRESSVADSNCPSSQRLHFSGKSLRQPRCSDKHSPAAHNSVCCWHRSTVKRSKNMSCLHPASSNQHKIFPHQLFSVEKPSAASEARIPNEFTSPLADTHNASLLFNVGTLLEMV